MSGVELKEQGNRLFAARQYEDAAACYSKAISQNPSAAIYYTNRALCFLKLQSWTKVVTDCQKAIELDPKSVKGYYFLGQAHLEQKNYDDSITNFKRAHDLARDQKLNFGDDIASEIRIAKKQRWSTFEEKRITQEIELQTYVNRLIQEDRERQISELSSDSKSEEEVEKITSIADERLCQLNELFAQVDDRRKKRDVPEYLCGKISFEIMRDPVITPSGITYDRKNVEEHLQRVGHFDPITRAELTSDRLIPNLAMKEVIDCFLEENGWAIDY
ncbi:E3 ubiquitin-protein ligase CHIP-like isoform X2 [Rhopilema esculentum]|uniref:E3 ubiquitin-protein ligase CHIP-like isoform X2 n=1 Tax=Rhopilema esculentum TaxID=499914 RepID=UPI0031E26783